MSTYRDSNSQDAGTAAADTAAGRRRPAPVRLAGRGAAGREMLSRVLPDAGLSRLDVAAFQSSI